MISLHPAWRADLKGCQGCICFRACANSRGCCRLTVRVRSSFIQQVCRRGFSVFVKNIMALSSVGLYSAIQMEVKAAMVQRPRSTAQLERFALINAENEASKRAETPEQRRGFWFLGFFVPLTNAQNLSPRSHKWIVILLDNTEM